MQSILSDSSNTSVHCPASIVPNTLKTLGAEGFVILTHRVSLFYSM